MMSIGTNLRLDHLEESGLRSKKSAKKSEDTFNRSITSNSSSDANNGTSNNNSGEDEVDFSSIAFHKTPIKRKVRGKFETSPLMNQISSGTSHFS
jgi:hypothetical protein